MLQHRFSFIINRRFVLRLIAQFCASTATSGSSEKTSLQKTVDDHRNSVFFADTALQTQKADFTDAMLSPHAQLARAVILRAFNIRERMRAGSPRQSTWSRIAKFRRWLPSAYFLLPAHGSCRSWLWPAGCLFEIPVERVFYRYVNHFWCRCQPADVHWSAQRNRTRR